MDYEDTFIVSPELQTEQIEQLIAKVTKIIEISGGIVKAVQQLGKKRLAYPINKAREGIYVYMEFSGASGVIVALENFFKFNDSVIRFLTIKIENKKVITKSNLKTATADGKIVEVEQNEPAAE
jgi:small subunit ribosomal protein S6